MDGRERQPPSSAASGGHQPHPSEPAAWNGEVLAPAVGTSRRAAPSPRRELIGARGILLSRSGRTLLQDVDIDVAAGEIVTLIGPNGAGKTTLVRVLLGIVAPNRGEVRRKGGLRIGYVPQRLEVDRTIPLTVARFVALGRRARSRPGAHARTAGAR
jgi:ABC-type molybdenum transport system ATPase subunit/photorepair protein PhrA